MLKIIVRVLFKLFWSIRLKIQHQSSNWVWGEWICLCISNLSWENKCNSKTHLWVCCKCEWDRATSSATKVNLMKHSSQWLCQTKILESQPICWREISSLIPTTNNHKGSVYWNCKFPAFFQKKNIFLPKILIKMLEVIILRSLGCTPKK